MAVAERVTWRPFPPPLARGTCTLCRGTGWQLTHESGAAVARRCSCYRLARAMKMREHIRIPPEFERCTLSTYQPQSFTQSRALREAAQFAERFPNVARGLFFTGEAGTGKTHLSVGIILELVRRLHEDLLFVDFPSLPDRTIAHWRSSLACKGEVARMKLVSLLVLDDFGAVEPEPEILDLTCEVLEARTRMHRITILTGEPLGMTTPMSRGFRDQTSRTRAFLGAVPPALLWRFLGTMRLVPIQSPNCIGRSDGAGALFRGAAPEA